MAKPVRLRYQTVEVGDTDIHVCSLRDNQQFSDPEGVAELLGISSASWPLFGVIWPSSLVLAHHICDYQTTGKRILEVGCGMAVSSLLLNKQNMDITSTDHHPDAQAFLNRNSRLNDDDPIAFERSDWNDVSDTLGLFDLIIGSDLLYEDEHVKLLAGFINRHSKPTCEIILVDPGRGRKNKLARQMDLYGYEYSHSQPEETEYLDLPFKGHIMKFWRNQQLSTNPASAK